jgi:hypothetical protein
MPSNDYVFVTRWRMQAGIEEVSGILQDPLSLPRWWPSVYLEVTEIEPGGPNRIGRVIELFRAGFRTRCAGVSGSWRTSRRTASRSRRRATSWAAANGR